MRPSILLLAISVLAGPALAAPDESAVLRHYADLAHAGYADSLATAQTLRQAVQTLIAAPDEETLAAAREAWRAARVPYAQTEAFRFANPIVDAWEGRVNAWPLDEGLIDYVAVDLYGEDSEENPLYSANIIANPRLAIAGKALDASVIDKTLLAERLHEAEGVDTNVARGYHAIEFLLWGQDRNGTGPGAGARPATDFDTASCTGGHCDRRAAYLAAATDLLVDDLAWMTAQWATDGAARESLIASAPGTGAVTILSGIGSLSFGELAGERLRLGLMLHDPEEEQDCFSDNTHWSLFYDAVGIRNVYLGTYRRPDGTELTGPAVSALVAATDPELDARLRARLDETVARMQALVDSAERDGVAFDQLIAAGNTEGNAVVQAAIDALVAQTRALESALAALEHADARPGGDKGPASPSSAGH